MSRIISLEVENFKRIKAVRIEPNGNLVIIGGKNAQGKTSLLDALMFLLKGKSHLSGQPIHEGEDEALVRADLGDFTAQRKITKKGPGALIIKPKPGVVLPDMTPHAMFSEIIGPLTVNPVGFMAMDPKEQLEVIREMVGLDTSEIDAERDDLYERRTETGREVKRLTGQVESMPEHDDAPDEEVSISGLMDELAMVDVENEKTRSAMGVVERLSTAMKGEEQRVKDAENALARAVSSADEFRKKQSEANAKLDDMTHVCTDDLRADIAGAENTNAKVRANATRRTAIKQLETVEDHYEKLSGKIKKLDAKKKKAMAEVELPIKGMGFNSDGLTYKEIPLCDASSAEQLRISVAVGVAGNPEFRGLLVRGGSLLDEDSLAQLDTWAEEQEVQILLERVGHGGECQFIIEDGMVKDG